MCNFDEIIDRRNTNTMKTDGFRDYIFRADESMTFPYKDEEFIRMWAADMEFAAPDVVIDGIRERLDKRIFGYTRVFSPGISRPFPPGAAGVTAGALKSRIWSCQMASSPPCTSWWNTSAKRTRRCCF